MNVKLLGLISVFLVAGVAMAGAGKSGLKKGEFVPAFEPKHVWGPDKGTDTCPVCKYTKTPAVQVWVGNDSTANLAKLASDLEQATKKYGISKFRVFFVFTNPSKMTASELTKQLTEFATTNKLKNVALTFVDSASGEAAKQYAIDASAGMKNTVMVYSGMKVVANFNNLVGDGKGLSGLNGAVAQAVKLQAKK